VIQKDCRLGVGAISKMFTFDRKSVRFILTDGLNMKKVHAEMVPKMLLAKQNELQKELCSDHLQRTQNEMDLLKSVIVMRLGYLPNLETKLHSSHQKSPNCTRAK